MSMPDVRIDEPNPYSERSLRVALYSHDAMGIGHVRRNQLIAQALSASHFNATSLLLCGAHEAAACAGGGHGIDCLTLPSLEKYANDDYRPRDLRMTRQEVASIRAATLESAILAFQPDLFLVDKVPRGIDGELDKVLPRLREIGTKTVFGMRDILDEPQSVIVEWTKKGYHDFVQEHFDEIWVYGDPVIFDPVTEYRFGNLAHLVRYTGYIDQCQRLQFSRPIGTEFRQRIGDLKKTILCMVGGGQDGVELASAFARASLPKGYQGLLITGPLMCPRSRQQVSELVSYRDDVRIVTRVDEADLLVQDVNRVVCMGGYNSMLSVASFEKPALVVPRVQPRQEQLIRARRFQELGFLEYLHPDRLTADAITAWLSDPIEKVPKRDEIDLNGLQRVVEFVGNLVHAHPGQSSSVSKSIPNSTVYLDQESAT